MTRGSGGKKGKSGGPRSSRWASDPDSDDDPDPWRPRLGDRFNDIDSDQESASWRMAGAEGEACSSADPPRRPTSFREDDRHLREQGTPPLSQKGGGKGGPPRQPLGRGAPGLILGRWEEIEGGDGEEEEPPEGAPPGRVRRRRRGRGRQCPRGFSVSPPQARQSLPTPTSTRMSSTPTTEPSEPGVTAGVIRQPSLGDCEGALNPAEPDVGPLATPAPAQIFARTLRGTIAVSYTHLTLPTKA